MKGSACARTLRSPACFPPPKSGKSKSAYAMQRHQLEHIIRAAAGITGAQEFVAGLLRHGLLHVKTTEERLAATSLDAERRQLCAARLQRLASKT